MITPLSRQQFRPVWRSAALALSLLWSAGTSQAATYTALTDAIPYASWNAAAPQMDDIWAANTGTTPVLASGYFTLGNGVIQKTLPVTATQNFELKVDALHGAYSRTVWVGLFNAAGTQGYALLWNSAAGPAPAQGVVSIRKYSVAGPGSLLFNTYGTVLGTTPASGHPATTGALAQLKLTWNSATSTLTLSVDGVVKSTVVDSSYSSFSRIFVAGNDSLAPTKIDNLSVTLEDSTAPTVALTAPVGGATVSGTVALSATASDAIGLAGVQFKLNNTTNLGAEDTTSTYGVNWNTTTLENGVYQLTAVARDLAGNLTTSTPVSVFVNNATTAGAVVPWTYYEAEDATRHASAVLQTGGTWGQSTNQAAFEARGKQCVTLDAVGEFVRWTNVVAANRLTVRYNLPAETDTTALELWVNGIQQPNLALSGARTRETKPVANVPNGVVRFWDDVMVTATIPNGATVELRHGAGTLAVNVDFLELETAPPPLTAPDATWVSVSGFDRTAITTAITAATTSGSKKVWFPAGTYSVAIGIVGQPNSPIVVPSGFELRGAGIWHTTVVKTWGGTAARLFRFAGTGNVVQDMKVVDTITTLAGNEGNNIFDANDSINCVVKNIWSEYASLVLAYRSNTLTVRDCRVRNGYKDAIHIATTGHHGLIENCTFRNAGDDCAAFVIYSEASPAALSYNTARHNTMECTYWGRSVSLQGGDNNLAEYNRVRDSSSSGVHVSLEGYAGSYYPRCTNFMVRNNVVIRCGNDVSNNRSSWGAISITRSDANTGKIYGVVEDNIVFEPPFHASTLRGKLGDLALAEVVYFRNNYLEAPTFGAPPWSHILNELTTGHDCIITGNTLVP